MFTDTKFGFTEPEHSTKGRFSVSQGMEFLEQHSSNPTTYTATEIAKEYQLDEAKVADVLSYFKTVQCHFPKAILDKHPKLRDTFIKNDTHGTDIPIIGKEHVFPIFNPAKDDLAEDEKGRMKLSHFMHEEMMPGYKKDEKKAKTTDKKDKAEQKED